MDYGEENSDLAIRVKDGIFVGNHEAALDRDMLLVNRISYIINCASEDVPNYYEWADEFRYLSFPWKELGQESFSAAQSPSILFDHGNETLTKTVEFIDEAMKNGECVLIHSRRGVSRAPALLAGYFVMKYHWRPSSALDFIHSAHPLMAIQPPYLSQIHALSLQLRLRHDIFNEEAEEVSFALDYEQWMLRNTFLNSLTYEEQQQNDLYQKCLKRVDIGVEVEKPAAEMAEDPDAVTSAEAPRATGPTKKKASSKASRGPRKGSVKKTHGHGVLEKRSTGRIFFVDTLRGTEVDASSEPLLPGKNGEDWDAHGSLATSKEDSSSSPLPPFSGSRGVAALQLLCSDEQTEESGAPEASHRSPTPFRRHSSILRRQCTPCKNPVGSTWTDELWEASVGAAVTEESSAAYHRSSSGERVHQDPAAGVYSNLTIEGSADSLLYEATQPKAFSPSPHPDVGPSVSLQDGLHASPGLTKPFVLPTPSTVKTSPQDTTNSAPSFSIADSSSFAGGQSPTSTPPARGAAPLTVPPIHFDGFSKRSGEDHLPYRMCSSRSRSRSLEADVKIKKSNAEGEVPTRARGEAASEVRESVGTMSHEGTVEKGRDSASREAMLSRKAASGGSQLSAACEATEPSEVARRLAVPAKRTASYAAATSRMKARKGSPLPKSSKTLSRTDKGRERPAGGGRMQVRSFSARGDHIPNTAPSSSSFVSASPRSSLFASSHASASSNAVPSSSLRSGLRSRTRSAKRTDSVGSEGAAGVQRGGEKPAHDKRCVRRTTSRGNYPSSSPFLSNAHLTVFQPLMISSVSRGPSTLGSHRSSMHGTPRNSSVRVASSTPRDTGSFSRWNGEEELQRPQHVSSTAGESSRRPLLYPSSAAGASTHGDGGKNTRSASQKRRVEVPSPATGYSPRDHPSGPTAGGWATSEDHSYHLSRLVPPSLTSNRK